MIMRKSIIFIIKKEYVMSVFYLFFLTTIVVLSAIALSLIITIIPNTHPIMSKEEKKDLNTTLVGVIIMTLLLSILFYMFLLESPVL